MTTLAELQAQQAILAAQIAVHDREQLAPVMTALADAEPHLAILREAMTTALGSGELSDADAKQRCTELLNVLNIMPGLLTTIVQRISTLADTAPSPE